MSRKNFIQIPSGSLPLEDRKLRSILEPIRDAVQRRFQGSIKGERVITRDDLVELGLATKKDIEQLKD